MEWCCVQFKNFFESAGHKGIGIHVEQMYNKKPTFLIQFRIADQDVHVQVNADAPVTLAAQTGIRFCPWCGIGLSDKYESIAENMYRPDLSIT